MDFFQQQDKARRKTKWLILYFVIAVAAMTVAVYLAVMLTCAGIRTHHHRFNDDEPFTFSFWDPKLFLGVSLGTLAIVGIGCGYRISQLSAGGSAVAEMMGGRLVSTTTQDPDERKLLNVVEEMAIASGIAMPQVYVMHYEDGINAFAAGFTPADATVTVSRGCIKILNRDELQGVIGHEFSHILNGDMRLNIRLIGILFGILCVATIGRILMRTRGRNNGLPIVLGLLLLLIGSIGVFFGRLIQAAISRQREFLADASSVQFTRNPDGIVGALKKIGGLGKTGSQMIGAQAGDVSHMFFANGLSDPLIGLLATHPPLADRIRAIQPAFDGKFPYVRYDDNDKAPTDTPRPKSPPAADFFGTVLGGTILAAGTEKPPIPSHTVLPNVGNPTPMHLRYAEQLRDSLPETIKAAARDPLGAVAIVYAMLLSCDDAVRAKQTGELARRVEPDVQQKTVDLFPAVSKAATHVHLPIINLALGSLKQLTCDQYKNFSETLDWLIDSDGKTELFEYVLRKVIRHHLALQFEKSPRQMIQYYAIKPLVADCAVLLSALANISSSDPKEVQNAFNQGIPYLRAPESPDLRLCSLDQCGIDHIDAALDRMTQSAPLIKRNLIEACSRVVGADGVILETEAELLRAIADTLDCPIPPFVTTE